MPKGALFKVKITQEHYDTVRATEKEVGKTVFEMELIVPDCINGQWGVYQVHRCFRSFNETYFADMSLQEYAEDEQDAEMLCRHMIDD